MPKNQLQLGVVAVPSLRVEQAQAGVDQARDEDLFEAIREIIERIIAVRGRKTVAAELDVAPSQLSDSLTGNGGKQLQLRWLPTIARIAPPELRGELHDRVLDAIEVDQPLTPEEELAQLRAKVLSEFGAAGARAVAASKRRGR